MNIEQIKSMIPHRYPMLMIDSIDDIEALHHAHGYKCVTANEPFFTGHFPNYAVFPGVFIIEAVAQLSSAMILMADQYKGMHTYYTKMAKVKFFSEVRPGDRIELFTKVLRKDGDMVMCQTAAKVGGENVFAGEITLMAVDLSTAKD